LPEHPIISTKQTMEEVLEAHKMEDKKQKDREVCVCLLKKKILVFW